MRRVVVILLTLVLVPSLATASWYRCAFDGKTRAVCCCPTKPDPQNKAPAQDASVRAACCCTVTHVTVRAVDAEVKAPASTHVAPTALSVPTMVALPRVNLAAVVLDRPRAHGDPPDTLFSRRCSLLL